MFDWTIKLLNFNLNLKDHMCRIFLTNVIFFNFANNFTSLTKNSPEMLEPVGSGHVDSKRRPTRVDVAGAGERVGGEGQAWLIG
jgi:hypothetical protein